MCASLGLREREELSAVCVFSLSDINKVMDGPFKELKKTCDSWINPDPCPRPARPVYYTTLPQARWCLNNARRAEGFESSLKLPDKVLTFTRDHPLMENSLPSAPLLVRRGVTYTKMAVTLAEAGGDVVVLHLGTDRGELHRVAVVDQNTTLLHEIPLFPADEPINNIVLHQGQALVGTPVSLARVGAQGCGLYTGCRCSPAVRELRVSLGLRLLLPCVQVSPRPCFWDHPPQRHTRQHHTDLEVTVSPESLGTYVCTCQLVVEVPSVGGAVATAGSRHLLAIYILCFMAGVSLGGFLLYFLRRRRRAALARHLPNHAISPDKDLLGSTATPQSPSSASFLTRERGRPGGGETTTTTGEEVDEGLGEGLGDCMRGLEAELAKFPLFKSPAPLAKVEESSI
ncbi:hypothetical protein CRUP_032494 [Coryphaenoides rupestris]|nr:hypothetical protein CRUP_032494 [Coryphaenoides rupestris]